MKCQSVAGWEEIMVDVMEIAGGVGDGERGMRLSIWEGLSCLGIAGSFGDFRWTFDGFRGFQVFSQSVHLQKNYRKQFIERLEMSIEASTAQLEKSKAFEDRKLLKIKDFKRSLVEVRTLLA
jgi:hypothetical protein